MSSWRAFCHTVHLASLGVWAGAVVMAGATAAVAFPTLRDLNVRVSGPAPGFEDDHFRFAAGAVAQRVFLIGDVISFACAMLSGVTLLALIAVFGISARRPATIVRALALGVALASLAAMLLIVTPRINAASVQHFAAAKSGDAAAAAIHKHAVADLHPLARNLLFAEIVAVLVSLVSGAWSLATSPEAVGSPASNPYPEPDLLRRTSV
jgi:hypothetical protein